MSLIIIKEVESTEELRQFVDLPWQIYHNDKNWIPKLKAQYFQLLDRHQNPFWEHAERALFLAYKDGVVSGRIAAITNDNHNQEHREQAGFFGFYECVDDNDVARHLFEAACVWCRARGCAFLRGPASPSVNDEYGWLLEGYDTAPAFMMAYNPPYYLKQAEIFGMKKVKDLFAFYKSDASGTPDRFKKIITRIRQKSQFTLRTIDMNHFVRDLNIYWQIYSKAWEKNWGAVPLTHKEMMTTALESKDLIDPKLIVIAETKIGNQPAGISITLPNYNEVFCHLNGCNGIGGMGIVGFLKFFWYRRKIRGCRAVITGCLEEYRKTGLIAEIAMETLQNALDKYEWCELSWTLEDNDMVNRFALEFGSILYKKYRLYEMPL